MSWTPEMNLNSLHHWLESRRTRLTMGLRFSTRWMPTMPRKAPKLSWRHQETWGETSGEFTSVRTKTFNSCGGEVSVAHSDARIMSGHRDIVGASGRDEPHSQDHQRQSQERDGHPQGRPLPTQILNWGQKMCIVNFNQVSSQIDELSLHCHCSCVELVELPPPFYWMYNMA